MIISAKFSSVCPDCGQRIAVGAKVNWSRGAKARHVNCPIATEGSPSAASEAPSAVRSLVARYRSLCGPCGQLINPGEAIVKVRGSRSVHAGCAEVTEACTVYATEPEVATREEQRERYDDCGPGAWDDRDNHDTYAPENFDF
jgi:hypothetical protein